VKYAITILAILASLSASLTLAEDFRTVNGKEYKDVTISRVEADGIVLRTKSGISKVYFVELPNVQERFHHGSATPAGKSVMQRIDKAESANHAARSSMPPIGRLRLVLLYEGRYVICGDRNTTPRRRGPTHPVA
jgi:hypothetical protein